MARKSILLVMAVLLAACGWAAAYSGGTGEPNDPYLIATAEDLNDIGNHYEDFNKCFLVIADINLADYTGTEFNIIGTWVSGAPNDIPFTGIFDGNDHKIGNFTWSSTDTDRDCIGLFGYLTGQIKDLRMENVDVNATNDLQVGGLVGYHEGTITNCHSSGSVSGASRVGGLVGCGTAEIVNSSSTGTVVSGAGWVGGLVGWSYCQITNCYSTANVSGVSYWVGGLVGRNRGEITNSYATGTVSGGGLVGGLAGDNYERRAVINSCYSTGSVSGTTDVGGLVGRSWMGGTVIDSFWDIETSGQTTSDGGTGKTTAEMKTRSTFTDAGWDFIEIWNIGENQTYPYLRVHPTGDINHDDIVNFYDLAILADHWLEDNRP